MSHHGMELQRRLIELFRADTTLASTSVPSLVFPAWALQVNGEDYRIYEETVELPENPAVREALPRVLVGVLAYPAARDQFGAGAHEGPATATLRIVTPKEESELGEDIASRCATLIASTRLSNARIIAAELVPEGRQSKGRISAFNGAWEIVDRYGTENVGVIV